MFGFFGWGKKGSGTTSSKRLEINYRALYVHKRGNELLHYEDAFAMDGVQHVQTENVSEQQEAQGTIDSGGLRWRVAVADGAAEGGFSKLWARMLVDHFVWHDSENRADPQLDKSMEDIARWLKTMSRAWVTQKVPEILSSVQSGTPKYARMQQSLLKGQASTLLMLELDAEQRSWQAAAIGDAFLFHIGRDYQVYPIRPASKVRSEDLDTNPVLISTQEANHNLWIWNNKERFNIDEAFAEGSFELGDQFVLVTDALAKWILRVVIECEDTELAQNHLMELLSLANNAAFAEWVAQYRSLPKDDFLFLGNDDTTMAIVSPQLVTGTILVPLVSAVPVRTIPARSTDTNPEQSNTNTASGDLNITASTAVTQPAPARMSSTTQIHDLNVMASSTAVTQPAPSDQQVSIKENKTLSNSQRSPFHSLISEDFDYTFPSYPILTPTENQVTHTPLDDTETTKEHLIRINETIREWIKIIKATKYNQDERMRQTIRAGLNDILIHIEQGVHKRFDEHIRYFQNYANNHLSLGDLRNLLEVDSSIKNIVHSVNMNPKEQHISLMKHIQTALSSREKINYWQKYIQDSAVQQNRLNLVKSMEEFVKHKGKVDGLISATNKEIW